MACCLCRAGQALFFSFARESALEPSRVSGRTKTTTYGKSAMVREREEQHTLPSTDLFGKVLDESHAVGFDRHQTSLC